MFDISAKKSVGLDISDNTIEVAQLIGKGDAIHVANLGRISLAQGIVERGRVKDKEKLKKAIQEVFLQAKPQAITPSRVIFGLPENLIYTHVFELGVYSESERDHLIQQEAQTSIPLPSQDLLWSYKILKRDSAKEEVLLIVTSKSVVHEWQEFFRMFDFDVLYFDIEPLATFRGIFTEPPKTSVCIVDMGARITTIAIFDSIGLRYSYTVEVGGNVMTEEIVRTLHVSLQEAEEMKISYGLLTEGRQLFFILIKILEPILREIKASLAYAREHMGEEVEQIVLVGGSSKLKGLVEYVRTNLLLPTWLGEASLLHSTASLEYIEAIGLALRPLDTRWEERDPVIPFTKEAREREEIKEKEPLPSSSKSKELIKEITSEQEGHPQEFFDTLIDESTRRLRFEKNLLTGILISGIIFIGIAYQYGAYTRGREEAELKVKLSHFTKIQSFNVEVPAITDVKAYKELSVRARIIENTLYSATSYAEALRQSKTAVQNELGEGEKLWDTPINQQADSQKITFPLTIRWLVYSDADVTRLFLNEVNKLNTKGTKYLLNTVEIQEVKVSPDPHTFSLSGTISIALDEFIPVPQENKEE